MGDLKILFDGMLAENVKTGLALVIALTLAVTVIAAVLTARYLRGKKEDRDAE